MKVSGGLMFGGVIDGTDGVAYELRTSVDTLTMPSGATSATFAFKASCYSKSGNAAAAAYPCYFSVYRRTGTSLVYATRYASKVSSRDFSISNVACTVDAIVVFATDTLVSVNASAPTTYVAKCEMAVLKDAPYYVDEYARSITRDSDGYLYSKIDSSTGTSPIDSQPGWTSQAPNLTDSYPYIWRRTALYTPSTNSYGNFAYVCLTGEPGEPGAAGKTGRMFYLAGSWDGTKTYERNDSICPIVEHGGSYWYLDADSSTGDTPNNDSTVWKKCENFGVVLTEALFADFGKLSKAIMSGDYIFSMDGHIGNTEYNDGAFYQWDRPAYLWFVGETEYKLADYSQRKGVSTHINVGQEIPMKPLSTMQGTAVLSRVAAEASTSDRLYLKLYDVTNGTYLNFSANGTTVSEFRITTSKQTVTLSYTNSIASDRKVRWRVVNNYSSSRTLYIGLDVSLANTFEPNWWVNLRTGKMVGAKKNFVVEPDGSVSIAKDKFTVDSDGNVVANNITIKGSLMFHKTVVEYTYDYLAIAESLGQLHISMKGDIFIIGSNSGTFEVSFPPAYLFPGAQVRLVITRDMVYELAITRLDGEHEEYRDVQNEVYNGFMNILTGTGAWGVDSLTFSSYTLQGYTAYKSVELVSVRNPIHPTIYKSSSEQWDAYVWMIVGAKE